MLWPRKCDTLWGVNISSVMREFKADYSADVMTLRPPLESMHSPIGIFTHLLTITVWHNNDIIDIGKNKGMCLKADNCRLTVYSAERCVREHLFSATCIEKKLYVQKGEKSNG